MLSNIQESISSVISDIGNLILLYVGISQVINGKTATMTAKSIYLCYGAAISSTAYVIGVVLGTILSVSLIAGIKYLGNHRVWY